MLHECAFQDQYVSILFYCATFSAWGGQGVIDMAESEAVGRRYHRLCVHIFMQVHAHIYMKSLSVLIPR